MEYNRKAHSVYLLTYHIVFVTKYRRPVISDEIGYFMKNHAAYLCGRFGGEMVSAETDEDHIHLLVSMPPDVAPSRLVATLKTQLSKEVRAEYQEVPAGGRAVLEQQLFYCNYRDNGYGEGKRIYRKAEDRRTQTQICQERKICKEEELA